MRIITYKQNTGAAFGNARYACALAEDLWPFVEDNTLSVDAIKELEDYKFIKEGSAVDEKEIYSREFAEDGFIESLSSGEENVLDENDNISEGFLTKMENAIVRIEAKKGGSVHSHSTGYIIGGKYVATCHHCVNGADSFTATVKIKQGAMNFEKNIHLSVIASSEDGDCAILAIKDSFENGSVYPSLNLAPEGELCSLQDKVFSAGYPLGIRELQLHTPSKVVGTNSGYILFEGQAIHQGDSGAPIINTDGLVIGYLCGSINHSSSGVHAPSETNRFAHIDNLYRLMKNIKNKENI